MRPRPGAWRTAPRSLLAVGTAALLLGAQIGPAAAGGASGGRPAVEEGGGAAARTVKERLSSKARDEQRVDNCKVPRALRGPKPRPDCGDASRAPRPR